MDTVSVCVERLRCVGSASIIQHVSAAAAHVTLLEETEGEMRARVRLRQRCFRSAPCNWRCPSTFLSASIRRLSYSSIHRFVI